MFVRECRSAAISVCVVTGFLGCATNTVPFTKGKSIEVEGSFFSRAFKQDGKPVRFDDVTSNLKKEESSKDKASASEIWYYTALVSSGVGGYLVGYNALSSSISSDSKQTGLLLGVGILGVAFASAYFSDKALTEGVEAYNSSLPKNKRVSSLGLIPIFGFAESRFTNSLVPTVGFSYQIP